MSHRRPFASTLAVLAIPVALYAAAASHVPMHDDRQVSALWQAPVRISDQDLFNGPWGAASAPAPDARYTFVRRKHRGTNPGVVVRDKAGRIWHVKQPSGDRRGDEGPAEVVVSRVLSAVGYHQPPVYFLRSFKMTDARGDTRTEKGGRFRLDEPRLHERGTWSWSENPFVGTRPYNGLLVILLMFNSWDMKDGNNALYDVDGERHVTQWYVVRDLGGSLGGSGTFSPRRNDIGKFERHKFIAGVHGEFVTFDYRGKHPDLVRNRITVNDVRWAGALLASLSDAQWRDAFRAGGYDEATSGRFIRRIKVNIDAALQVGVGVQEQR